MTLIFEIAAAIVLGFIILANLERMMTLAGALIVVGVALAVIGVLGFIAYAYPDAPEIVFSGVLLVGAVAYLDSKKRAKERARHLTQVGQGDMAGTSREERHGA